MYGSSIVALGAFNPSIVTPDWLESRGLLGKEDAEEARQTPNLLISHQVAQFEGPFFVLQLLENQFSLTSKGAMTALLKDLFVGILQLLPQTPVTALGINFHGHYKLDNLNDYHAIGDAVAPKGIWKSLFPGADQWQGLQNLTMRIEPVTRNPVNYVATDYKLIMIQPSSVVKHGVYLSMNDHRDIASRKLSECLPAETAAEIVDQDWDSANDFAIKLFNNLIDITLQKANQ